MCWGAPAWPLPCRAHASVCRAGRQSPGTLSTWECPWAGVTVLQVAPVPGLWWANTGSWWGTASESARLTLVEAEMGIVGCSGTKSLELVLSQNVLAVWVCSQCWPGCLWSGFVPCFHCCKEAPKLGLSWGYLNL